MRLHGLVLLATLAITCPLASTCFCSPSTMPEIGDEIEVLLQSEEIVRGILMKYTAEHLVVRRQGLFPRNEEIPCADIKGLRRVEDPEFSEFQIEKFLYRSGEEDEAVQHSHFTLKVRVYDKLPYMGLAVAAGVFAGDRFARASSERKAADLYEELDLQSVATDLESDASSHELQAWIGVTIAAVTAILASIPDYEEIPIPVVSLRSENLTGVRVGVDMARLLSSEDASGHLPRSGLASSSDCNYPIIAYPIRSCLR